MTVLYADKLWHPLFIGATCILNGLALDFLSTIIIVVGSRRNVQFLILSARLPFFLGNLDSPHRVFEFCIPVEDSMDVIVSFSVAV